VENSRRKLLAIGTGLIGASLIVFGFGLDGISSSYWSSLCLELGAASLLVIPILWIQNNLQAQVDQVRKDTDAEVEGVRANVESIRTDVAAAQVSIGELGDLLAERLNKQAREDDVLISEAEADPSFEKIHLLYDRAQDLGSIDPRGIRMRLDELWFWIRIQTVTKVVMSPSEMPFELSLQDFRGHDLGPSALWYGGETLVDPIHKLTNEWIKAGSYPGNAINPDALARDLIRFLRIAVRSRTEMPVGKAHAPLIEIPTPSWAITKLGLERVEWPSYEIPIEDIIKDPEMRKQHLLSKTWLEDDTDIFLGAFEGALRFFEAR